MTQTLWQIAGRSWEEFDRESTELVEPAEQVYEPLTVATDGSVGSGDGSWALFDSAGYAQSGFIPKAKVSHTAELKAISRACLYRPNHPITILTDSLFSVNLIEALRENDFAIRSVDPKIAAPFMVPGQDAEVVRTVLSMKIRSRIGLEVQWVKSHNGHELNELADRLALMTRRCKQMNLPSEDLISMRARLVSDYRESRAA